jgi:hypothetical protein
MASGAFAFVLLVEAHVAAQRLPSSSLDSQVITAVDRLYPGFLEILESGDPSALATLSRTLVANPSPESLAVLLWMLQYGPSWSAEGAAPNLQIANLVRATGRLPLAPLIGALQHTEDEQRIIAVNVLTDFADQIQLGAFADQIQPGQRAALEKALIGALSDRNVRMREFVAQLLRLLVRRTRGQRWLEHCREMTSPTCSTGWRRRRSDHFHQANRRLPHFPKRRSQPSAP